MSFAYALSSICILVKRLKGEQLPPPTRFSMGESAVPMNTILFAYVVKAAVASFFPASFPVNAESVNWSCAMFGGVFLIAVVDYLVRGRKHYVEPVKRAACDTIHTSIGNNCIANLLSIGSSLRVCDHCTYSRSSLSLYPPAKRSRRLTCGFSVQFQNPTHFRHLHRKIGRNEAQTHFR
jgi:hypothetical protein